MLNFMYGWFLIIDGGAERELRELVQKFASLEWQEKEQ